MPLSNDDDIYMGKLYTKFNVTPTQLKCNWMNRDIFQPPKAPTQGNLPCDSFINYTETWVSIPRNGFLNHLWSVEAFIYHCLDYCIFYQTYELGLDDGPLGVMNLILPIFFVHSYDRFKGPELKS